MAYHFDERTLIYDFAKDNPEVPELEFIRQDREGIKIKALTGGMVNYVFRVQSHDEKQSLIIKYAEETMRLAKNENVSLDRQVLEYDSLCLVNSILPGSAPKAYVLDCKKNILAMEDLSDMQVLGNVLKRGEVDLDTAKSLGKTFAFIHQETTEDKVGAVVWQEWLQKFRNKEQLEYYSDLVIERLFVEGSSSIKVAPGALGTFRKCVKLLETAGFIKKLSQLFALPICFIHADCYFEAVFVKGPQVKMFDFEFAFISHPAAHLGFFLPGYSTLMLEAFALPGIDRQKLLMKTKQAIHIAVSAYIDETNALRDERKKEDFLRNLALFTGHGFYNVAIWVTIDTVVKNTDEQKAWLIERGTQLMLNHENITSVDKLVKAMFDDINITDA